MHQQTTHTLSQTHMHGHTCTLKHNTYTCTLKHHTNTKANKQKKRHNMTYIILGGCWLQLLADIDVTCGWTDEEIVGSCNPVGITLINGVTDNILENRWSVYCQQVYIYMLNVQHSVTNIARTTHHTYLPYKITHMYLYSVYSYKYSKCFPHTIYNLSPFI